MKTFIHAILAATLLLAAAGYGVQARAEEQYRIVLEAKGEAAQFLITAPQASTLGLKLNVALSKGEQKTLSVATSNVVYYEFAITACGKTSIIRFTRAGKGVTVDIHACGVYWFNQIR